jgi:hypothetical protein
MDNFWDWLWEWIFGAPSWLDADLCNGVTFGGIEIDGETTEFFLEFFE